MPRAPRPQVRRARGFTLIELMVTVVVIGVLLAIAFPSYQNAVRKGRRADAFAALTAVQQAQERHRANRAKYANSLSALPNPTDADALPNMPSTSSNGHYGLDLDREGSGPTGYTAIATARGAQAADGDCAVLVVKADRGRLLYGSGSGTIDWSTPTAADRGKCWVK